jgi:hypothetical protein
VSGRLSREELLDEVEWLLDGGVHPLQIAATLNRLPASISRAAELLGRTRVVEAFASTVWEENRRNRRRAA